MLFYLQRVGLTLLVDPTIIAAEQHEAQMTDLGGTGSRPVVATLQALGLIIAYDCKATDTGDKVEIVQQAFAQMPTGKAITTVLLDAEYSTEAAVRALMAGLPEQAWTARRTQDGMTTAREVAETVHSTNQGQAAFRLVILRWRASQGDLVEETTTTAWPSTGSMRHRKRSSGARTSAHIEHHIKERKGGFGRERLPSGDEGATAVHVAIGVMTLLAQRRLTMPETWATKTIRSIRWCLVEIGGKRITHGRQRLLKLAASVEKSRLYCERRWRTAALSSA
jgi:hypothetical protein